MVFKGRDRDEFCQEILRGRVKRMFISIAEVEKFISEKRLDIEIKDDDLRGLYFLNKFCKSNIVLNFFFCLCHMNTHQG